jgi:hypothetical protein
VTAFFVAAAGVVLVHFARVRDRRILPLAAAFALFGLAETVDHYNVRRVLQAGGIAAGLSMLALVAPTR